MFAVSKILAPVVFSANCRGALRYAVAYASRFGAEVAVLHVLEPPIALGLESSDALGEIERCHRKWADTELDKLVFEAGRRVVADRILLQGDPATEIVSTAQSRGMDLIVMATHGHGRFRRFLLGSVTAKVLHDASCPVWTGAHLENVLVSGLPKVHRVACAVEFNPQADAVLDWSAAAAKAWGAELTLLHVVPEAHGGGGHPVSVDDARRRLTDMGAARNADARICVVSGTVPANICQAVKRIDADLLVIGRGHAPGAAGRLRNMAYSIIRESPCAVTSV